MKMKFEIMQWFQKAHENVYSSMLGMNYKNKSSHRNKLSSIFHNLLKHPNIQYIAYIFTMKKTNLKSVTSLLPCWSLQVSTALPLQQPEHLGERGMDQLLLGTQHCDCISETTWLEPGRTWWTAAQSREPKHQDLMELTWRQLRMARISREKNSGNFDGGFSTVCTQTLSQARDAIPKVSK